MPTPSELLAKYSTQAQIGSFFVDKIGQIWVSAYGAVGDGVTDDTAAVQAAVNAAKEAGICEVNFTGGKTYKITSLTNTEGIVFLGNNVTITGGASITVQNLGTHLAETAYETAARNIYVSTTGNDTTGDGSAAAPYRTITKALSKVNKNIATEIQIRILPGDYTSEGAIYLKNYRGTRLLITAYDGTNAVDTVNDNYIIDHIVMYDSESIYVQGLKCVPSVATYSMYMSACKFVRITGCKIDGTGGSSGYGCTGNSFVWLENCSASNCVTVISANHGATVVSQGWTNSTGNTQGIVVDVGSKVHLYDDSQPTATTKYLQSHGGVIFDSDGNLLYTPQMITTTKEAWVAEDQVIAVNSLPRYIQARAFVNGTKKVSTGAWCEVGGSACNYIDGTDGNQYDGTGFFILIEESPGNYTLGTISAVTNSSFTIHWVLGGTGATGIINIHFEVAYH